MRKPYLSRHVLYLGIPLLFLFVAYRVLLKINSPLAEWIAANSVMPTSVELFIQKPFTLLSALFFHQSGWVLLTNLIGLIIFGNLTSMLLSKKLVVPLFLIGGLFGNISIWIFKEIPLLAPMLDNLFISGASGAVMSLAVISTFYMPDQIVRLYGIFPLKLKVVGRVVLFFSFFFIFLKIGIGINVLNLGGALGGYLFLVLVKRNKFQTIPFPFLGNKKMKKSAIVEMKIIHNKPLTDEEFNEIQISKKEYLDHLLDKIGRNGVDSLSKNDMDFLKKFGSGK